MNLVLLIFILVIVGIFNYNNLYGQEFNPSDFDNPDTNFLSNAEIIAQEISLYTDTEIKDYPLADLPAEEIKAVFMILDLGNITKILLNIPVNDIQEIQNKLSEEEFNSILNRVSIENQTLIKDHINNN